MVASSCKFLSNLVFKSYPIVIRIDDTKFLATWDDAGNVGVINPTKAELKEFTTSIGPDKGEHINIDVKKRCSYLVSCVRSQTRNTDGNGRSSVQIETGV